MIFHPIANFTHKLAFGVVPHRVLRLRGDDNHANDDNDNDDRCTLRFGKTSKKSGAVAGKLRIACVAMGRQD